MEMIKYFTVICFFFQMIIPTFLFGQSVDKHKDKVNGESFIYYMMQTKADASGILLLLPGSGEKPKSIFEKTSLPQILAKKGFVTVIPELNNSLFADKKTIRELNKILETIDQKYSAPNLIIGGFSSGGAVAIGYAEYLLSLDTKNKLKGVFAIDPPLDLTRLYNSAKTIINSECQGLIKKEGHSIKQQLEHSLGGSPDLKPDQYIMHSSYSANDRNGGNAKYLKNIPVRLYSEPDLDFVKKTYCSDLQIENINAIDLQRLHKFLLGIGNSNAEYITTKDKGFHSWNILDASDCAEWATESIN